MRESWPAFGRLMWQDRPLRRLYGLSLALSVLLMLALLLAASWLPEEVSLHFSVSGPVDRTGPAAGLLTLPIIGLLCWLLAVALAWNYLVRAGERPIAMLLGGAAVAVQLAAWAAAVQLILASL
jgi:hypothetical protein